MRRTDWVFHFKVEDLLPHVQARCAYHRGRLDHWQVEAEKTEEQVRREGVSLTGYPVTGGQQFRAEVKPALMERYATCQRKVDHHRELLVAYDAYRLGLEATPADQWMPLDQDDVRFFIYGEDADAPEEDG